MFKQVVRYTVVALIWRRYRLMILASVALLGYFWLVSKLHSDFLVYTQVQGSDADVGLSFFVKWLAYLLGLMAYLAYVFLGRERSQKAESKPTGSELGVKSISERDTDPFDQLRKKTSLQSQADKVIEKYPKK